MQTENYVIVNNKSNFVESNIFNYCLINKISSLSELMKLYRENGINFEEVKVIGINNLLNYRFFEKKLPDDNLLFKHIKFISNKVNNITEESLLYLQKLGFNKFEIKLLIDYLILYKKPISIISAFLLYRNDNNNLQNYDGFNNKLDIIIDYYYNMFDLKKVKKVEYECLLIKKKMIVEQEKIINKKLKLLKN